MIDVTRAIAEELAIELLELLPCCEVTAGRSDWIADNYWQVNIWKRGQPRFTASFKPEAILVTTLNAPGSFPAAGIASFEYYDPDCIDEVLRMAVSACSWPRS